MAGKAIGISMGFGYPGNYARTPDDVTVSRVIKASSVSPVPFGACLKLNSDNTVELVSAGFTAADFAGIAVREVKTPTNFMAQNTVQYRQGEVCDALVRGAIIVTCNVGTPTAGGAVYVRIAANASIPDGVVGGFEAAADSTNTVLLPNVKWTTGAIDANKSCEVTILTRVNP